jgi:NDP-sugar pyrophosphorylase family protein
MAQHHRRCLIVPAAGLGSRFAEKGYRDPKPFIRVNEIPMVELVVKNIKSIIGPCRTIIVLRESMKEFVQHINIKDVEFDYVPSLTQGAANTVEHALHLLDEEDELIVANSDQIIELEQKEFDKACINSEGTIVTFSCPERNAKWSYAELDEAGFVKRVAEKKAISENATVGVYRFSSVRLCREALTKMYIANDRTNGEFYFCPAYNHLQENSKVTIVNVKNMWGMGTPEDLEKSVQDEQFKTIVFNLK